jgi:hypothetical protein
MASNQLGRFNGEASQMFPDDPGVEFSPLTSNSFFQNPHKTNTMPTQTFAENIVVTPSTPLQATWTAWIDRMPPPPDTLHVRGLVTVPNPGVDVFLYRKEPQGINPAILILDLVLVQRPGIWPQVLVTKPVTYEEVGRGLSFTEVSVTSEGTQVASIPVDIVQ